ncbi:AraC family transcriptional regulator [Spirochaetia bacterium]|nr:AraC family transcriptional regulator [Spirochaetia bacterium]
MELMEDKPSYDKRQLDAAFPLVLWDNSTFKEYPMHWQKTMEILYLTKGHIRACVNGKFYDLKQGDIIFINPEMIHGYCSLEPVCQIIVFLFGLELFEQSLDDLRNSINQMIAFNKKMIISAENDSKIYYKIKKLILNIRNEYVTMKKGYRLAIKKDLFELGLLFLRELPDAQIEYEKDKRINAPVSLVERILAFIHENFDDPDLDLDKAAEAAALSKFYFTRFFRERTGITFHAYLSKLRINRAMSLLSETEMPVTEIVYNCGFSSINTFNRVFKNYTGVSPLSYRSDLRCLIGKTAL